jgi:hypothetical protein
MADDKLSMLANAPNNAPPVNPSEQAALETAYGITADNRVPMDIPQAKLGVPSMPGWFFYWHLESNVPGAIMAGYTFVDSHELGLNQMNVATDGSISGNEDLGSRIKRMGGVNILGQAEYHVLMKLPMAWRLADQRKKDQRNASIMQGIFKKEKVMDREGDQVAEDVQRTRYVKTALFDKPVMKRV